VRLGQKYLIPRQAVRELLDGAGEPDLTGTMSKRLGHADIRTTSERYLHVYLERDAAAASVFDTLCG
jgi:integrase